jgi:hypothetical protein
MAASAGARRDWAPRGLRRQSAAGIRAKTRMAVEDGSLPAAASRRSDGRAIRQRLSAATGQSCWRLGQGGRLRQNGSAARAIRMRWKPRAAVGGIAAGRASARSQAVEDQRESRTRAAAAIPVRGLTASSAAASGAFAGAAAQRSGVVVAIAEAAVEEVEDKGHDAVGQVGVVAEAFVAQEGVGSVDLDPAHPSFDAVEAGLDLEAAFEGDVGILAAPDHEEFALDVGGAGEGVVLHAGAEGGFVEVGGVEADGSEDLGVEGGAKGEVSADADAHDADFAVAVGARKQMVDDGARVGVVAGEFLGGLEGVAAVGSGLVVLEDLSGGFELVIDLRDGDDVAMSGEHGGGAADGRGDLKDLGVQKYSGIFAFGGGAEDMGSHGAVGSREVCVFAVDDDHKAPFRRAGTPPPGVCCKVFKRIDLSPNIEVGIGVLRSKRRRPGEIPGRLLCMI